VTVKALPTATIGGTTTVCQNTTSPQITFYNPQSPTDIVITYNINGVNQTTIDVTGASSSVSAPTSVPGVFTYTIVSVKYQDGLSCSNTISGESETITVTPTVGTPTTITISEGSDPTCQLTNGTTTTTYSTTATNSTGFNWSISNGAAGSINASSGLMTWTSGFSGNVDIRVTASGCGNSECSYRTR